jgi:hypothetical protein
MNGNTNYNYHQCQIPKCLNKYNLKNQKDGETGDNLTSTLS